MNVSAGFLLALKLLDLMALGVQSWAAAQPAVNRLQARMKVFAQMGREPTAEEWHVALAETDELIRQGMKDPE